MTPPSDMARFAEELRRLVPRHLYFVGVDSDGCVFPTMELKQRQCFQPLIVKHFDLDRVADIAKETAEFVSLRSRWRGSNRFEALLRIMDLLQVRREVREAGISIPYFPALRRWVGSGVPLSEAALAFAVEESGDPELLRVLEWSRAVNGCIERSARSVPPFPSAREALRNLATQADVVCISQTPAEALAREWEEQEMRSLVAAVAGQEAGPKSQQIRLATRGRYAPDRMLILGDAPGDLDAAREVGASFYPIEPGREEESWRRLLEEAWPKFLTGTYTGRYETDRIAAFEALLPSEPPWEVGEVEVEKEASRE